MGCAYRATYGQPGSPSKRSSGVRSMLIGNRTSEDLEHPGGAHATADAHRHAHPLGAAALAFDQRVAGQALARHAVGVAHGDGAAVHVELVVRNAQLVAAADDLHGESFVELPEVDVADL